MSPATYCVLLAGSIVLFVLWGGPMWSAGAADSHLGRFLVSYGSIPLVSLVTLLVTRAYTTPRYVTAVGTLWAIKLVLTAVLYFAFGPRGGMMGTPVSHPPKSPPAPAAAGTNSALLGSGSGYEPAEGDFDSGVLSGRVVLNDQARGGVLVMVISPKPGRAVGTPNTTSVMYDGAAGGFASGPFMAMAGSSVNLNNRDGALRIFDVTLPSGEAHRSPVPPAGVAHLEVVEVGRYRLRVDGDKPAETALVVLDHPYWTRTDASGQFKLDKVPTGKVQLRAMLDESATSYSAQASIELQANAPTTTELSLTPLANK